MASTRHRPNHAPRLEPNPSTPQAYPREPPRRKPRAWPVPGTAPITHLDWNPIPQRRRGDPVSRLGASRGHGQYPAPPQSRTSIGTRRPPDAHPSGTSPPKPLDSCNTGDPTTFPVSARSSPPTSTRPKVSLSSTVLAPCSAPISPGLRAEIGR